MDDSLWWKEFNLRLRQLTRHHSGRSFVERTTFQLSEQKLGLANGEKAQRTESLPRNGRSAWQMKIRYSHLLRVSEPCCWWRSVSFADRGTDCDFFYWLLETNWRSGFKIVTELRGPDFRIVPEHIWTTLSATTTDFSEVEAIIHFHIQDYVVWKYTAPFNMIPEMTLKPIKAGPLTDLRTF